MTPTPSRLRSTLIAFLAVQGATHLVDIQLKALHDFYEATDGENWADNTNWDTRLEVPGSGECAQQPARPTTTDYYDSGWPYNVTADHDGNRSRCYKRDPCRFDTSEAHMAKWYGVGCVDPCYYPTDGNNCDFGRVTYLKLPKNSLAGSIPESFFAALTNLTYVDMSFNEISGTISGHIENARNLEWLSLGNNRLSGTIPSEIDGIGTNLMFEESIDSTVANRGLTHLDVSHNNLSGTVPTDIGELGHLKMIDFSHNSWLGDNVVNPGNPNYRGLPEEIGNLAELESVRLDYSGFGGYVPTQLGALAKLRYFSAHGNGYPLYDQTNHFSGTLPTQLGNLKKVQTVRVPMNQISGTVPASLKDMTVLRHFDAQENTLSGTLPEIFTELRRLNRWDTFANSISGSLPQSMVNASALRYLFLQKEQAVFINNARCRVRVPGIGNHDLPRDSRSKLREVGQERNKYNWYQLAADYFKYRDPFAFPADGGVPFRCETGAEDGCDGRTDCDPGVNNTCPGVDEVGMAKHYSLSGAVHGEMFKKRWAGVLYCANKYDAVKTFLRLCEMEGDCDGDGYSTSTDPDSADFRGNTTDGDVDHMPEDDGSAEAPMGRRRLDKGGDGEAASLPMDTELAAAEEAPRTQAAAEA